MEIYFLASWLRISYLFGTCLNEQLRALRIFLQSSTGNKFLGEFLDVGGLFTLLEILNVNQINDDDKQQAVNRLFVFFSRHPINLLLLGGFVKINC